ncbi:hypothetical protein DPX16_5143 [Anabarilius grahami]|uniref:Uncharacterized protein n=1 Tax=Anabarilius grahami TaxID=495550 RepID=A0A3N0XLZ4_ANAGA|nr:hypothetical protein DPX16_5143 [Anabarilius grahami]
MSINSKETSAIVDGMLVCDASELRRLIVTSECHRSTGAFVEHTTPCAFGSLSRCFDVMRRLVCEKPMHLKQACPWKGKPVLKKLASRTNTEPAIAPALVEKSYSNPLLAEAVGRRINQRSTNRLWVCFFTSASLFPATSFVFYTDLALDAAA